MSEEMEVPYVIKTTAPFLNGRREVCITATKVKVFPEGIEVRRGTRLVLFVPLSSVVTVYALEVEEEQHG